MGEGFPFSTDESHLSPPGHQSLITKCVFYNLSYVISLFISNLKLNSFINKYKGNFFFHSLAFILPQCRTYTHRDLFIQPKCLWTRCMQEDPNYGPEHQGGPPSMWSAEYQGHRQRQHMTEHKGNTASPSTEIKIADPPGIEPGLPGSKACILSTTLQRRSKGNFCRPTAISKLRYVAT